MTETPGSPSTQAIQVDLATLDALATPCGVPPAGRGTLDFDYEQMRRRQQHHDGDRGHGAPRPRTRSWMGERGNPGIFVSSHNVGDRKAS